MSNIKSKDLSYDKSASQPAFLQRLRDQNSAITSTGRHEQPIARARLPKNNDDNDDAPTYVVEGSSETLTKAEYEKLALGDDDSNGEAEAKFSEVKDLVTGELTGDEPKASGALPDGDDAPVRASVTVDAGTATKKRKVGKVVGADDEDSANKTPNKDESKPKKLKKKGKPIKLSFGDEE
ncbi:hypothetical protein E4T48_03822 [Aureobasidium sp. EXF-10727]|nr:hypothetical protein E4T48_03822 [Aureobasidium sp. EXF-10727]